MADASLLVLLPFPGGAMSIIPVVNQHGMTTRAKPTLLHSVPLSPSPKTFRSALVDPNWLVAME